MEQDKELLEQAEHDLTMHTIWVDEEAKIASFSKVDHFEVKSFSSHDHFMDYVNSLQNLWFRFQ